MIADFARPRSIALFYVATFLYWSSMYVYMPILAVHAEKLGASAGLVGAVVGAYGFSQLVLRIPLGIWSDRVGMRKPFIIAGIAAAGIGALGLGLTDDPLWLVVWRAMSGVGAAAWVVFTVLFASYFTPEAATRAMGRMSFISGLSHVVSVYAGGLMAQAWGWHAPFFASAVLAMAAIAVALPLEEKPLPPRHRVKPEELLRIATVPMLVVVSSVTMLTSWTQWATVNGFSLVYAARLGADRAELGLLTTAMQGAYTLGALLSSFAVDRIGARRLIMGGIAVQAAGAIMVPWLTTPAQMVVAQILGGGGRGVAYPILMGLSIRAVPASDRATAMGVFQAVYALGMFSGPAMSGLLADSLGLPSVFYAGCLVSLLGVAVVMAKLPART